MLGVCTTPTIGATVVDMTAIPGPSQGVAVEDKRIGASTRSMDGTLRTDTFALKRVFTVNPSAFASNVEWWSILRYWKNYAGPWILFDQTVANLLTSDQKRLITWTNASGANSPERLDGAVNLAAAGVTQMGPSTSPTAAQLCPVTVGTSYTFGIGLCGAGGAGAGATWQAGLVVEWYTAAMAPVSSSTATFLGSAPGGTFLYADGSIRAGRYWLTATAPATAAYAQIRITNSGSTSIDVLDPAIIPGSNDVGNAYTLVNITAIPETHEKPQVGSLSMQLEEI